MFWTDVSGRFESIILYFDGNNEFFVIIRSQTVSESRKWKFWEVNGDVKRVVPGFLGADLDA